MVGRDDTDTEVKLLVTHGDFDPSVRRTPLLGDIDFGQDFDPGDDRREHSSGGILTFNANAIDSIPNSDTILEWFDVNIACTQLDRFLNHQVYQANHRCGTVIDILLGLFAIGVSFGEVDRRVGEFLKHRVSRFTLDLPVIAVDGTDNGPFRGECCFDLSIKDETQFFDRFKIKWVRDQNTQGAIFFAEGKDRVFTSNGLRYQFDHFIAYLSGSQIDIGDLVMLG